MTIKLRMSTRSMTLRYKKSKPEMITKKIKKLPKIN